VHMNMSNLHSSSTCQVNFKSESEQGNRRQATAVKSDEHLTYLLEQATQFFSLFSEARNEQEEMAQAAGESGTPQPLASRSRHSILQATSR
jgi:hypothetical protein